MIDPLVALNAACINLVQEGVGEIEMEYETYNPDGTANTLKIIVRRDTVNEAYILSQEYRDDDGL